MLPHEFVHTVRVHDPAPGMGEEKVWQDGCPVGTHAAAVGLEGRLMGGSVGRANCVTVGTVANRVGVKVSV